MSLYRAYALLDVKQITDGPQRRVIRGIASTPTPDRQGHILEAAGATFPPTIPLLLHHRKESPVGTARLWHGDNAIEFEAELPVIEDPGPVKDEVDRAWTSILHKLIRAVSIGWRPLDDKAIQLLKNGLVRFLRSEILELSLVTVPANHEVSFAVVKAFDLAYRAAAGLSPLPGDAGAFVVRAERARPAMTITETTVDQIKAFEATRAANVARMGAIMEAAGAKGETLDAAAAEEYDTLAQRNDQVDAHLVRLRAFEKSQAAGAVAIPAGSNGRPAETPRPVITVKANVEPGIAFVRAICAKIHCKGNVFEAAAYAERWKDSTPEVALFLKAAIAPGTIQDPAWAGALVGERMSNEFIALLRPATAIGKIEGWRKVPFGTKVPAQTGGGTYGWVGEGKPKPVTKLAFTSATLPPSKAAGIIVLTEELVRLSSPDAEQVARDDMINGIAAFLDQQLLDPAVAAVVNVHPASLTNGVTPIASVAPLNDIVAIAMAFTAVDMPIDNLAIVMSPTNALVLSFAVDANGNPTFPGLTQKGGTIKGLQVVTSKAANGNVIGIVPGLVLHGDLGGVEIDVSREASLQMSDTPMDPADATTVQISLWQNNLVGLRAERFISWLKAHPNAVNYVNNAAYTIPAPALAGQRATAAVPPTKGNGGTVRQ